MTGDARLSVITGAAVVHPNETWSSSSGLEACLFDDLQKLLAFRFDEGAELIDRYRHDLGACLQQLCLHVRLYQDFVDLRIEPRDDWRRSAARRKNPLPERDVETGNAARFGDRRHLGRDAR